MLYQATRQFGDFENGIEIPYGGYVDTECSKWVQRFGPILRPLNVGEAVKGKVFVVKNMIEDAVVVEPEVIIAVEPEAVVESEPEVVVETEVETVVETTPLRRKIKPPVSPA